MAGTSGTISVSSFSEQGLQKYEQKLTRDPTRALNEGSRHFEENSAVKEKPVSFPNPSDVNFSSAGVSCIYLPTLIEVKLVSGMTNPGRMKNLSGVLELIMILNLRADFTDHLNSFVKAKYLKLGSQGTKRYETLWRSKWLTAEAKTIDDMIHLLRSAADQLDEMRKAGVTLEDDGGIGDDYATLTTTDPNVANKIGMEEEREYLDEQDEEIEAGP
jgi:hypothetical protein